MNKLRNYVVSQKLAKRMNKLGWDKETIFYWVKFDEYDKGHKWKLCLRTEDSFITIDGSILTEITERSEYYPAPLFAEIWEEFKNIKKDSYAISLEFDAKGKTVCKFHELTLLFIKSKHKDNPAEVAGEMWCWHREQKEE